MFSQNKSRREIVAQASQTHKENLRKNIQRRIEAARASGDEKLVSLLEAEANYIG